MSTVREQGRELRLLLGTAWSGARGASPSAPTRSACWRDRHLPGLGPQGSLSYQLPAWGLLGL